MLVRPGFHVPERPVWPGFDSVNTCVTEPDHAGPGPPKLGQHGLYCRASMVWFGSGLAQFGSICSVNVV